MRVQSNLMRSAAVAVGFAALTAVPAFAADVVDQAPAPPAAPMEVPPVASWAGGYVGAQVGYGFSGTAESDFPAPGNDIDTDGFVGGAFAGWNWQQDRFVYGIEGDVGYNGMEGANAGVSTESGVDGSLRARLGLAATDNLLIYGTAGGAAERMEVTEGGVSDNNTMLGWTAGVGVDAKVTENVFTRLEYRYTDYGSEDFATGSGTQSVDSSNNKVMLGVGMQF